MISYKKTSMPGVFHITNGLLFVKLTNSGFVWTQEESEASRFNYEEVDAFMRWGNGSRVEITQPEIIFG